MPARRLRRAAAILALIAASLFFPLSDLSAAPRSESRWNGPERSARVLLTFWHVLTNIFEMSGARMDPNG